MRYKISAVNVQMSKLSTLGKVRNPSLNTTTKSANHGWKICDVLSIAPNPILYMDIQKEDIIWVWFLQLETIQISIER